MVRMQSTLIVVTDGVVFPMWQEALVCS